MKSKDFRHDLVHSWCSTHIVHIVHAWIWGNQSHGASPQTQEGSSVPQEEKGTKSNPHPHPQVLLSQHVNITFKGKLLWNQPHCCRCIHCFCYLEIQNKNLSFSLKEVHPTSKYVWFLCVLFWNGKSNICLLEKPWKVETDLRNQIKHQP